MNTNRWEPVTASDAKPDNDGIEFTMTKNDRDQVMLARCDIIAMQFGRFTPGLVVRELQPSDLTESERRAFGFIGGAA